MVRKHKKGFTLVELLAVIVILAIILVIAVPQIMKTIDESREGSLSSSAKLIAASAEREYLAKKTLEDTDFEGLDTIPCSEVAETTSDYTDCSIKFDDAGKASVSLVGAGKFAGKYVCNGTRTSATVTEEECGLVALTVDPNGGTNTVEYNAKYASGSTVTLTPPTAPEGKEFDSWEVTGTDASVEGNTLTMGTSATTVKAIWRMKLPANANDYIENLLATVASANGLENPKVTNNGTEYDMGIRYTGNNPKNYVWFNCNDEYKETDDSEGIPYGESGYNYEAACEKWQIVGIFNTKSNESDTRGTPRMKIVNTSSAFKASFDSIGNYNYGVNQWGKTATYEGADLMRLLNGYYIETNDDEIDDKEKDGCVYCDGWNQDTCTKTKNCPLLKPLTKISLKVIGDALWYTYASDGGTASDEYLQERGITTTYTGCKLQQASSTKECSYDGVTRENLWTGRIGLIYGSDVRFSNGWLHPTGEFGTTARTMTPSTFSTYTVVRTLWGASFDANPVSDPALIWPTVYLNSDVQIVDGTGIDTDPYVLSL